MAGSAFNPVLALDIFLVQVRRKPADPSLAPLWHNESGGELQDLKSCSSCCGFNKNPKACAANIVEAPHPDDYIHCSICRLVRHLKICFWTALRLRRARRALLRSLAAPCCAAPAVHRAQPSPSPAAARAYPALSGRGAASRPARQGLRGAADLQEPEGSCRSRKAPVGASRVLQELEGLRRDLRSTGREMRGRCAQAAANVMLAHFVGTVVSLWLLRSISD